MLSQERPEPERIKDRKKMSRMHNMSSLIVSNLTKNKPRGDNIFLIFDRIARIHLLNINKTSPNFQGCVVPN